MLRLTVMLTGAMLATVSAASAEKIEKPGTKLVPIDVMESRYDALLQELAGQISLKGTRLAVDTERRRITARRGDGVTMGIFLRDDVAQVQCKASGSDDSKRLTPSHKHRQNGWRTKVAPSVSHERLTACRDALASTLKRAVLDL